MTSSGVDVDGQNPNTRRLVIGAIVAALVIIAGVVAAFVLGGDGEEEVPVTTTSTTVVEEITTTTEPDTGPVAPLTGLRIDDPERVMRPALAVKIDNLDAPHESALPQHGLAKADVVFEEIVEGNITRLVAVFHSQDAGRVGPVRSARTTDIHILPQLGTTLLGWSGGNAGVVAAVRDTPSIVDLGHDRATSAYERDSDYRAPHNLFLRADELWDRAPDEVVPPSPIFEYRREEPMAASAEAVAGIDLNWGGGMASAPVSWRWNSELELYERHQASQPHVDAEGNRIVTQNVVVLITPYGPSPADPRSPEAHTLGSGEALVFTNGHVIRGTWDRPSAELPATLTDGTGEVIRLTPGQTWIELPRANEIAVVD